MAILVPNGPGTSNLQLSGGVQQPQRYYQTAGPSGSQAAQFSTTPPPVAPRPAATAGGGGGGGGVAVDPNAAKIAMALSTGQDSQLQTGLAEASGQGANYQGQAGQLYGQLAQGQNTIDQARKNIGITQINSIKDLMNTIRQGLQGTGVQLGNSNALDSSAAGAASRIYANYGNVETNKVNNAAATSNSDQDVAQTNLGIQHDVGMAGLKAFRDNAIAQITTDAQKGLDSLKQYISIIGGDGNAVNAQGIKQQILQNAQDKLGAVDQYIQSSIGGIHAATPDQLAKQAYSASNAGVVPSGAGLPFQLDRPTQSPQAQLGGAQTSLIPLALKPKYTT